MEHNGDNKNLNMINIIADTRKNIPFPVLVPETGIPDSINKINYDLQSLKPPILKRSNTNAFDEISTDFKDKSLNNIKQEEDEEVISILLQYQESRSMPLLYKNKLFSSVSSVKQSFGIILMLLLPKSSSSNKGTPSNIPKLIVSMPFL